MKKALVIEDNRQTADSLCEMLGLLSVKAEAVYGSKPALQILKTRKPDMIFLDINLPGLSGFEILGFLQREPRLASVPVIVVTSDDQIETSERSLRLGALKVMIKPVAYEDLEAIVNQINPIGG